MTTAAQKKAAKRARRPIYGTVTRVAVLETGEERLAIVASHPIDRRLMKERGYRAGDDVRLEIKKPRNVKFHRLAHAIGNLLVDNVEEFVDLSGHDALKRVQTESGVCCDALEIDLGPLGKASVNQARSLAFDEMEEDEFAKFFEGITAYIGTKYAHVMLEEVRAEFWLMVQGESA